MKSKLHIFGIPLILPRVLLVVFLGVFSHRSNLSADEKSAPVAAPITAPITAPNPAADQLTAEMKKAQITEKLGGMVDIQNLKFRNEEGEPVVLAKYFQSGKPVLVTMVYYTCPGLCNFLLNGFTNSIRTLKWTAGQEFEVLTVSINPKEGSDVSSVKKASYLKEYGRLDAGKGWHFLTGSEDQIEKLAFQLGFGFYYDEKEKEYAHSAGIFVLTPEGKISRVLYGIDYPNRDLKLALLEASEGRVGTVVDRFIMFCFKYDPLSRGYAFVAIRLVQAGGILMLLVLGIWLGFFWWGQRKLSRAPPRNLG